MNAERRKQIDAEVKILQGIEERIATIQEEEQSYLDNMPEAIQAGEKGEQAEQACQELSEAHDAVEQAINSLQEVV